MKNVKVKTPYESPKITNIFLETENILDQSSGGFFGEEDSFYQSRAIQVFEK